MQQTSKYQFNLVEGSDDFSPTPLNQNMEKVEEALEGMETAVEAAQEAAEEKPYVVGNYTGDGASTARHFNLGFKPSFLIIGGQNGSYTEGDEVLYRLAIVGGPWSASVATLENTGFYVSGESSSDLKRKPRLNVNNYRYYYIAFR